MTLHVAKTYDELIGEAKQAEQNDDPALAVSLYQRAIRLSPHDEKPYDRLMILHRKQKNYEGELRVINDGITAFEELYKKKSDKIIGKNKQAAALSTALMKSLGQKDKKGHITFFHEPIARWLNRKKVVDKKLK